MFWVVVGLMLCGVIGVAVRPLVSGREVARKPSSHDVSVFTDQLASIDRDVARGTLSEEQAASTRLEISRRILAADKRSEQETESGPAGKSLTRVTVAILAVFLGAGSLGLYAVFGSPQVPDLPLSERLRLMETSRPDQLEAEQLANVQELDLKPRDAELVQRLRDVVASRPEDVDGMKLLARSEAGIGRLIEARRVQMRAIEALGTEVAADDIVDLAVYMIGATGGYVSPEAEAVLTRALDIDPGHRRARHLHAIAMLQLGRKAQAIRIWQQLLVESPVDPSAQDIQQILNAANDRLAASRISNLVELDQPKMDDEAVPSSGNADPATTEGKTDDMPGALGAGKDDAGTDGEGQ